MNAYLTVPLLHEEHLGLNDADSLQAGVMATSNLLSGSQIILKQFPEPLSIILKLASLHIRLSVELKS